MVIQEYNRGIPGVDLVDQKRHSRIISRRRLKSWYKKKLYHFLDISLVNAHIILTTLPDYKGITQEAFRQLLVKSIIARFWQASSTAPQSERHSHSFKRLVEKHTEIGTRGKLRCVVCSKYGDRKQSIYFCVE